MWSGDRVGRNKKITILEIFVMRGIWENSREMFNMKLRPGEKKLGAFGRCGNKRKHGS